MAPFRLYKILSSSPSKPNLPFIGMPLTSSHAVVSSSRLFFTDYSNIRQVEHVGLSWFIFVVEAGLLAIYISGGFKWAVCWIDGSSRDVHRQKHAFGMMQSLWQCPILHRLSPKTSSCDYVRLGYWPCIFILICLNGLPSLLICLCRSCLPPGSLYQHTDYL